MVTNIIKERGLEPKTKAFIVEAIKEVLEDSDFGLELSEKAKGRLREASRAPKKLIPLSEIRKRYY